MADSGIDPDASLYSMEEDSSEDESQVAPEEPQLQRNIGQAAHDAISKIGKQLAALTVPVCNLSNDQDQMQVVPVMPPTEPLSSGAKKMKGLAILLKDQLTKLHQDHGVEGEILWWLEELQQVEEYLRDLQVRLYGRTEIEEELNDLMTDNFQWCRLTMERICLAALEFP